MQRGVRLAQEAVGVPVRAPVCVELGDDVREAVDVPVRAPVCVELGDDDVRSWGSHEKYRLSEQPLSATITDLTSLEFEAPP